MPSLIRLAAAGLVTLALLITACGSEQPPQSTADGNAGTSERTSTFAGGGSGVTARRDAALGTPVPAPSSVPAATGTLDLAGRRIVASASISLQVTDVPQVIAAARGVAERLGGFVESLQTSGTDQDARATLVVRVPEDQFFAALDGLTPLGTLLSQSIGTQDVTEQFIDLESRLRSAQREEESLLALLTKVQNLSEILVLERELTRIRADVERLQGQLRSLERRESLATITLSLSVLAVFTDPQDALLTIQLRDVTGRVAEVRALAGRLDGKVDRVSQVVKDGRQEASMQLRVGPSRLQEALAAIEADAETIAKEIIEGRVAPIAATGPEVPNATIRLTIKQTPPFPRDVAVGWGIIGAVVVVVLLLARTRGGRRAARAAWGWLR